MKKKHLIAGLLWFSVFLAIFFIINSLYIELIVENREIYRKDEAFNSYVSSLQDQKIHFLFIGSSHTLYGINPQSIPDSYNLATPGENYIQSYYKLKSLLEKSNLTIDVVISEIDLQTFSQGFTEGKNKMHNLHFYKQFIPQKDLRNITDKSGIEIFIESRIPVIGNGKDFLILPDIKNLPNFTLGWKNMSETTPKEILIKEAKLKQSLHFGNQDIWSNDTQDYFEKFLLLAKAHNITVILIRYPVTPEYYGTVMEMGFPEKEYYQKIKFLTNNTGVKHHLFDYHDFYFNTSHYETYFSNSDHLNSLGAGIFSKKIHEEIHNLQ